MDTRNQDLKRLKKECRRAKRQHVALWKAFGIFFLILTLICAPLCLVVKALDNTVASYLGGTFWKLENKDDSAIYYEQDSADFAELSQQVTIEGAVLLKNESNALPLADSASIRFFGPDQLKTALEAQGITVNDNSDTAVVVYDGKAETLQNLADQKKAGSLKNIILVLTAEQVSALKEDSADSILWVGDTSEDSALAEVLTGKANPSGRLPYTLSYENAPQNGIYTGYKYYETRYEDMVMGTGNPGNFDYATQVAYPFGYGLSYTTFTYSNMETVYNETTDQFEVTLTVTNTGNVPGKETVQVYAQSPYTDYDKEKGIEKSAVTLVGFGKTQTLAPGAAETMTVYADKVNLASYDANGKKAWILDAGKYFLTAATDAHNAANNILTAKGLEAGGDISLVYGWEQAELDAKTYAAKSDKPVAGAVSRRDWMGTLAAQTPNEETQQTSRYNPADYPVTQMPTLGAENGMKLQELIGLSKDDPKWQTLLDQLTFTDMVQLLADNYFMQMPIESIQAPGAYHRTLEEMGVTRLWMSTWNTQLIEEMASGVGNRCLDENVVLLRAEAGSAYSEDALLTKKITAAQTVGLEKKGVLTVVYGDGETFAQDAIMAGEPLAGQWLPRAAWELYRYKNDPVVVSAMRQACHRNLFALANSSAMNGIGENTTVSVCEPGFVLGVWIATPVLFAAFVFFAVMWHRGKKKWKKTEGYLDYRTMKNTLKEEKKQ